MLLFNMRRVYISKYTFGAFWTSRLQILESCFVARVANFLCCLTWQCRLWNLEPALHLLLLCCRSLFQSRQQIVRSLSLAAVVYLTASFSLPQMKNAEAQSLPKPQLEYFELQHRLPSVCALWGLEISVFLSDDFWRKEKLITLWIVVVSFVL